MIEGIYVWHPGQRVVVEADRPLTERELECGLEQSSESVVDEAFADGWCRVDGWLVNRYGGMAAGGALPSMHVRPVRGPFPRANDPAFWLRECMEREASLEDAREAGRDITAREQQLERARLGLEMASAERDGGDSDGLAGR